MGLRKMKSSASTSTVRIATIAVAMNLLLFSGMASAFVVQHHKASHLLSSSVPVSVSLSRRCPFAPCSGALCMTTTTPSASGTAEITNDSGSGGSPPTSAPPLPAWKASLVRASMLLYIAGMCLLLPLTLLPQRALAAVVPARLWSVPRRQRLALRTGQWCARTLLKLVPFCRIECDAQAASGHNSDSGASEPVPTIWVCNHTSMLDVFLLLAADKKLRGKRRRPIQIIYWKGLEKNPVSKLLFRQAGFIPVQMADNGNGNDNQYDKASFKQLLKSCKHAMATGFDIGILPEGQLNPHPERGLLPVFGGAQFLAKTARRPIQFMALRGANQLWHPITGMDNITGRRVRARIYQPGAMFETPQDFIESFTAVVGEFGKSGRDLMQHELDQYLLPSKTSTADSSIA